MAMVPFSHEVPGYPVMNLEQAQAGWRDHVKCGPECDAKPYFIAVALRMERAQTHADLHVGWNVWH